MILKFILLFISLFSTFLFLNVKITALTRAIAFNEYEKFTESKKMFLIMIISVITWSLFFTIY